MGEGRTRGVLKKYFVKQFKRTTSQSIPYILYNILAGLQLCPLFEPVLE